MKARIDRTSAKAIAFRRLLAFCVDWCVIALWAALVFGITMAVYSGRPPEPGSPWHAQAVGFAVMTLPVVLYFAIAEASPWKATVGKRVLRLCVVRTDSGRLRPGQALLRNLVKFAPWELGHLVANQAAFSTSAGIPGWVYVPMVAALAFPVWWLVAILVSGRAPYERVSSTQVASSSGFRTSELQSE